MKAKPFFIIHNIFFYSDLHENEIKAGFIP